MGKSSQSIWLEANQSFQVPNLLACEKGQKINLCVHVDNRNWKFTLPDIDCSAVLEPNSKKGPFLLYGPARRVSHVDTTLTVSEPGVPHISIANPSNLFAKFVTYSVQISQPDSPPPQSTVNDCAPIETQTVRTNQVVDQSHLTPGTAEYIVIEAGESKEVPMETVGGSSTLTVSFEVTQGRDVNFGVMLVPTDKEQAPVPLCGPLGRARLLQPTVLEVPAAGTLYVAFDNSASWFTRKVVRYSIHLGAAI